jgi:hypothetical protein
MPTTYSIRSGAGGGAKLNSIGLNRVAWLDSMSCAAAISQSGIRSRPAARWP